MCRVYGLNARYCQGQDGPQCWRARLPRIVDLIKTGEPPLIYFQEILPHQRGDIEQSLFPYQWFGLGRDGDFGGEQCPVGVARDSEVLGSTNIWLSANPDRPGSIGWDACLPRICTVVWLRHEGQRIVFASTHFDHLGRRARKESASLLCSVLNESHTIVAGDFNCRPTSTPVKILRKRFKDSFEESDYRGEVTTFHDFGRTPRGPQIDYLFYDSAFELERFEVLAEDGPDYSSDHFPLMAEYRFGR